jgi:hypothetical protein
MSLYWLYDLPNVLLGVVVTSAFVLFAVAGHILLRKRIETWVGPYPGQNDVVGIVSSTLGIFFGITLGLVAVGTWDTFNSMDTLAQREVLTATNLQRTLNTLPEPTRSDALRNLRDWADIVVTKSWPAQQVGRAPQGEAEKLEAIEALLSAREPGRLLGGGGGSIQRQARSVQQLNALMLAGDERARSYDARLTAPLWWIVVIGALLTIASTWFVAANSETVKLFATISVSLMLGLLIFFLVATDNPFRGDLSISSDGFATLRDLIDAKLAE